MPLTDAQWARIEPLLPNRTPRRGGRWRDHREVIDAIAWKFQTGSQWVHLPEKFDKWRGVYNRLRMWAIDGTRERVFTALVAQATPTAISTGQSRSTRPSCALTSMRPEPAKGWGEAAPAWIPIIGGKRVRPMAAVVPAVLGGLVLTLLFTAVPIGDGRRLAPYGIIDTVEYTNAFWQTLATVCVTPIAAWGPITIALAVAYYRRRRTPAAVVV
ncbi:transposase [Streptomyces sp. NPDC005426]|uniref:transposase n=1 Tax=Streptomyces sp. NPDC005426 TaxID=3155344 RepID=UPI0033B839BA